MSEFRRRLMMAVGEKEMPNYLCFTALESGTFTFTIYSDVDTTNCEYIEYSTDGTSWVRTNNVASTTVTITTPTILEGEKVYWRGYGYRYCSNTGNQYASYFSSTGTFNVSGNISSIILGADFESATEYRRRFATNHSGNRCALRALFKNCTGLVDASELILPNIGYNYNFEFYHSLFVNCTSLIDASFELPTILTENNNGNSYSSMFSGCSSLTSPPVFKMTSCKAGDFGHMFYNCTSLVTAPSLESITTLANSCFGHMFHSCTSLVNAATFSNHTTVGNSSFEGMYKGCTKLTTMPSLPATTLGTNCYTEMFRDCTSLEVAQELPATTLSSPCYKHMFASCTKLTTAPKIKATVVGTQSCYGMFDRCSKLCYIFCMVIDLNPSNGLQSWLYGVPNNSTCIFVKHIDATWTTTGASGVPANWTVIYYDPSEDKYYTDQTKSQECDDHGNPI